MLIKFMYFTEFLCIIPWKYSEKFTDSYSTRNPHTRVRQLEQNRQTDSRANIDIVFFSICIVLKKSEPPMVPT